jgi:hypothetical protein
MKFRMLLVLGVALGLGACASDASCGWIKPEFGGSPVHDEVARASAQREECYAVADAAEKKRAWYRDGWRKDLEKSRAEAQAAEPDRAGEVGG